MVMKKRLSNEKLLYEYGHLNSKIIQLLHSFVSSEMITKTESLNNLIYLLIIVILAHFIGRYMKV